MVSNNNKPIATISNPTGEERGNTDEGGRLEAMEDELAVENAAEGNGDDAATASVTAVGGEEQLPPPLTATIANGQLDEDIIIAEVADADGDATKNSSNDAETTIDSREPLVTNDANDNPGENVQKKMQQLSSEGDDGDNVTQQQQQMDESLFISGPAGAVSGTTSPSLTDAAVAEENSTVQGKQTEQQPHQQPLDDDSLQKEEVDVVVTQAQDDEQLITEEAMIKYDHVVDIAGGDNSSTSSSIAADHPSTLSNHDFDDAGKDGKEAPKAAPLNLKREVETTNDVLHLDVDARASPAVIATSAATISEEVVEATAEATITAAIKEPPSTLSSQTSNDSVVVDIDKKDNTETLSTSISPTTTVSAPASTVDKKENTNTLSTSVKEAPKAAPLRAVETTNDVLHLDVDERASPAVIATSAAAISEEVVEATAEATITAAIKEPPPTSSQTSNDSVVDIDKIDDTETLSTSISPTTKVSASASTVDKKENTNTLSTSALTIASATALSSDGEKKMEVETVVDASSSCTSTAMPVVQEIQRDKSMSNDYAQEVKDGKSTSNDDGHHVSASAAKPELEAVAVEAPKKDEDEIQMAHQLQKQPQQQQQDNDVASGSSPLPSSELSDISSSASSNEQKKKSVAATKTMKQQQTEATAMKQEQQKQQTSSLVQHEHFLQQQQQGHATKTSLRARRQHTREETMVSSQSPTFQPLEEKKEMVEEGRYYNNNDTQYQQEQQDQGRGDKSLQTKKRWRRSSSSWFTRIFAFVAIVCYDIHYHLSMTTSSSAAVKGGGGTMIAKGPDGESLSKSYIHTIPNNSNNNSSTLEQTNNNSNNIRISFSLHDPHVLPFKATFVIRQCTLGEYQFKGVKTGDSREGYLPSDFRMGSTFFLNDVKDDYDDKKNHIGKHQNHHGYDSIIGRENAGGRILDFTTTISTNLKILLLGDSITIQMSESMDEMLNGDVTPTTAGSDYNASRNCIWPAWAGAVGGSIIAPTRGGGMMGAWRITGLLSRSNQGKPDNLNAKGIHSRPLGGTGGGWNFHNVNPFLRHVYKWQGQNVKVERFDAVVFRVMHGWMTIEEITRERIVEAAELAAGILGAKTFVFMTVPFSNNVKTMEDMKGVQEVNNMIRDVARTWHSTHDDDTTMLVMEYGTYINHVIWRNARHLGYNVSDPLLSTQEIFDNEGPTFLQQRLNIDRWPPSIPMVCDKMPPNESGGAYCARNYLFEDGMHFCTETMAARIGAVVACLLGCVYNKKGPSNIDVGGEQHNSSFSLEKRMVKLRACERQCNEQFMSVMPLKESWVDESITLASFSGL